MYVVCRRGRRQRAVRLLQSAYWRNDNAASYDSWTASMTRLLHALLQLLLLLQRPMSTHHRSVTQCCRPMWVCDRDVIHGHLKKVFLGDIFTFSSHLSPTAFTGLFSTFPICLICLPFASGLEKVSCNKIHKTKTPIFAFSWGKYPLAHA